MKERAPWEFLIKFGYNARCQNVSRYENLQRNNKIDIPSFSRSARLQAYVR